MFFFFCEGNYSYIQPSFLQKSPENIRKYNEVLPSSGNFFVEHDAAPAKLTARPPMAWTGRLPMAEKKSTLLGASTSTAHNARRNHLGRPQLQLQVVRRRIRHPAASGEGETLSSAPESREPGRDGRSAAELLRAAPSEGKSTASKSFSSTASSTTPAPASTHPRTPNLQPYLDPGIPRPPAAEAAVGGRGIRRAAGGELMRTGRGKNRPSRYCRWGEGDGPTRLSQSKFHSADH